MTPVMYRIPDDDRLEKAIVAVVRKEGHVRSQAEMTSLVLSELRKEDPEYRVSGERIRRVAIERNILRVDIDYNMQDDRSLPDVCPVCGYPMAAVSNSTLDGRESKVGRQCTKCPYHTGSRRRTPGRYTFSKGGSAKKGMNIAERISMIEDAAKLMKKAASMIESATKGTEYERRGKGCARSIKRTMVSKKDGNSLNNIVKDLGATGGGQAARAPAGNTKLKDI
ncbi:MAG: hypothetical protein LBI08_02230 [Methanomassiliicoccaceae archaeon]|jgi:hypothetical protein|nr:hypothetical protein [Methanomassiliicoccaceae archaeon]